MTWNIDMVLMAKARKAWGDEKQVKMAIEEMGELLTAISHRDRGRCEDKDVAEEIADCLITLSCISQNYGEKSVVDWIAQKQMRLKVRLGCNYYENEAEIIAKRERIPF